MGKELLFKVLRHEEAERVPWVPFAGVHAGKLKGCNAREVLESADKLYESLLEVNKLYMPDGMPIMFDLQIEAEILRERYNRKYKQRKNKTIKQLVAI